MLPRSVVEAQLPFTIREIGPRAGIERYSGKVRDCFMHGDRRILVTTDRLSAFDRILTTIPFKGELLNTMAAYWFKETAPIVPNHLEEWPHPNIFVTREVKIIPIEVVVRGYLAGSAWRDYSQGRDISGIRLPAGMKKYSRFPSPLLTPSTKAASGVHDVPIATTDVVRSGVVTNTQWEEVCRLALALFEHGTKKALERGLLLVDTKYEFGIDSRGKVTLADEIHTQDSSRYWVASSYEARVSHGEDPEMLDKEFFRRWLIERGYMGDGTPPVIEDSFRVDTALKYIEAAEQITGAAFNPKTGSQEEEINRVLSTLL